MDSIKFPTLSPDWASQLGASRAASADSAASSARAEVPELPEIDLFTLLNSEDPSLKAQLLEAVVALEQKYKKLLDQGVAPADFARLNGMYQACATAHEILAQ